MKNAKNKELKNLLEHASFDERKNIWGYNCSSTYENQSIEEIERKIERSGTNKFIYYLLPVKFDYLTYVRKVADKLGVVWNLEEKTENIERNIIIYIFNKKYSKLNSQKKELLRQKYKIEDYPGHSSGNGLVIYELSKSLIEMLSDEEDEFFNGIMKFMIGPAALESMGIVGLILGYLYILRDFTFPNYKSMILTVIYIAYLRLKQSEKMGTFSGH